MGLARIGRVMSHLGTTGATQGPNRWRPIAFLKFWRFLPDGSFRISLRVLSLRSVVESVGDWKFAAIEPAVHVTWYRALQNTLHFKGHPTFWIFLFILHMMLEFHFADSMNLLRLVIVCSFIYLGTYEYRIRHKGVSWLCGWTILKADIHMPIHW